MKRFLSVLLSVILVIVCTFSVDLSVLAEDYKFGVDISEHDGVVSYDSKGLESTEFVMIRLGYYNHIDKQFWNNVKLACEAGLDFGVYLYSYAYNTEEAKIEADFVIDTLSKMPDEYLEYFTLPVAYDLEDESLVKNCKTKEQITKQMTLFCYQIENAGYTPMVYANLNWLTNYLDLSQIVEKGYKLWYAYWVSSPNFSAPKQIGNSGIYADIWQYQSGEDDPSGFDRNIAYDINSLRHRYKLTSQVKATCSSMGKKVYTCELCGEVKEVAVNKVSHSYKNVVTKATLTANGKIVPTCSACSAKKTATTVYMPKSFTLSTTKYVYNGNVRTPAVTVKDSKGKTLVRNTDYTLTYASGRKNVGKYAVKITFKGNYSGTKTLYFTIVPTPTTIASLTSASKSLTVKWNKKTAQVTGYEIQYSTSSKFTSPNTITMNKNSYSAKKITGLSSKKRYYVRIRTYKTVGSTKYYSSYSSSKSVVIK